MSGVRVDGDPGDGPAVAGERPRRAIERTASVHARLGSVISIGLIGLIGAGFLTWYYAVALARPSRVRQAAQTAVAQKAQSEAPLPSLGELRPPPIAPASSAARELPLEAAPSAGATAAAAPITLPELPLAGDPGASAPLEPAVPAVMATAARGSPDAGAAGTAPTPEARRLTGVAYARLDAPSPPSAVSTGAAAGPAAVAASADAANHGALAPWLRNVAEPGVQARRLPPQRLILAKGAFIDCTLETAIDSTLPGMTTCITATDVFGGDGTVVLLERGTKLIGETRGEVQPGAARVFVLWTEARTPAGVVVALASPGADELGRSGLPGEVDRHFWQRFGAAMLVSVIEGAVQAGIQSSAAAPGAVIVNPTVSQDVLTEVLKGTINIPPTIRKRNGDRIQVLVARDLDFRSVYALQAVSRR